MQLMICVIALQGRLKDSSRPFKHALRRNRHEHFAVGLADGGHPVG
jgi:hypothetical protein